MSGAEFSEEQVRGDAVKGFAPGSLKLSFYELDDQATLERVALVYAANRNSIDDVHYCEIDRDLAIGFRLEASEGNLACPIVNSRHLDFCDLAMPVLVRLVYSCVMKGRTGIVRKKRIEELLKEAILRETIQIEKINKNILKDLRSEVGKK